jgi:hypothetical protein
LVPEESLVKRVTEWAWRALEDVKYANHRVRAGGGVVTHG